MHAQFTANEARSDRLLRPIVVGIIFCILNSFWIVRFELMFIGNGQDMHLTAMSVFFNAIFSLFLLVLANLLLQKYLPKYALIKGELLIIYAMMNMASGIGGMGMMQILIHQIGYPFQYSTPENDWAKLFHSYVPSWLSVGDSNGLKNFYQGNSTLYTIDHFKAWFFPVMSWTGFIFALLSGMFSINLIVRRQWVEVEKLAYPTIKLPIEIINEPANLLKNRVMWIGFAIAAIIDIINGFSYRYPVIPQIPIKRIDISHYFTEKPLNAIGWTPLNFYPFVIGLGFLIPSDLSFSFWFFYLFWKLQNIVLAMFGLNIRFYQGVYAGAIYQSTGAFLGLCAIALFSTRKHLMKVFFKVVGKKEKSDDSAEEVSYRSVFTILIASSLFLLLFSQRAGMSLWLIIVFFIIYYSLCIAITRMRAEMGVPVHDFHAGGPDQLLPEVWGTRPLRGSNLTIMTSYWFFNRGHYSDVMPHQMEGLKIADRVRLTPKRLSIAISIGIFVGILGTFWASLHYGYEIGLQGKHREYEHGFVPYSRLASWLSNPTEPNYRVVGYLATGIIVTFFLSFMRNRFIWWPFHPAGFAISNSWGAGICWLPIFISWILKVSILRFGGLRAHQRFLPFFLGLMLGEFVVGTSWSLFSTITGINTYSFFPY